jgi:hypothetical protein
MYASMWSSVGPDVTRVATAPTNRPSSWACAATPAVNSCFETPRRPLEVIAGPMGWSRWSPGRSSLRFIARWAYCTFLCTTNTVGLTL